MKDNFCSNLEKAIKAKEACEGMSEYMTINIENDWTIKVYAHPSESTLHKVVSALTSLTGKLEKRQEPYGTYFHFHGENESLDVTVVTPEKCTIVGYKIETRPKKVTIESNEMETIKTPVTDCDFRSGKVKAGEFEPLQKETVA